MAGAVSKINFCRRSKKQLNINGSAWFTPPRKASKRCATLYPNETKK